MDSKTDIRTEISQKFIASLESGSVPWQRPWHLVKEGGSLPRNFVSKKSYRGANLWYLTLLQSEMGYTSPDWGTFKQISEAGGYVKRGEKSTRIMWWNFVDFEQTVDGRTVKKTVPIVKSFAVFNRCQTTLPTDPSEKDRETEFNPIESAENIIKNMTDKPVIRFAKQNEACYYPGTDVISMPSKSQFKSREYMYHTLFHEIAHSTGHKKRLNRLNGGHYSTFREHYSKEELVAETTAAYLAAECGFVENVFDNSTAYIQSWIKALKNDPRMIIDASSAATKAADYILGR